MRRERGKNPTVYLIATVFLTCYLVQMTNSLQLRKTQRRLGQRGTDFAPSAQVQEGKIVFGKLFEVPDRKEKHAKNASVDDEIDYQADFAGWSQQSDIDEVSKEKWNRLGTSLHCFGDRMKFRSLGPGASQLAVEQAHDPPVPLSMVPSKCGYRMHGNSKAFVMMAPYDSCNMVQQGGNYMLPLFWQGHPLSLLCPKLATTKFPQMPPQMPQVPLMPPQVPQMPPQMPQVPQMPPQMPQVPQMPPQIPQVPLMPPQMPQVPQLPPQVPQVPQMPPQIPQVPLMPPQMPQVPQLPPQVPPQMPQVPQMPPQVPQMPPLIPQVPQMPPQVPQMLQFPEMLSQPYFDFYSQHLPALFERPKPVPQLTHFPFYPYSYPYTPHTTAPPPTTPVPEISYPQIPYAPYFSFPYWPLLPELPPFLAYSMEKDPKSPTSAPKTTTNPYTTTESPATTQVPSETPAPLYPLDYLPIAPNEHFPHMFYSHRD